MPSIRLNIKIVASATPANTEVSTGKGCHGLLNNTKITMIGRTAMATCEDPGFLPQKAVHPQIIDILKYCQKIHTLF